MSGGLRSASNAEPGHDRRGSDPRRLRRRGLGPPGPGAGGRGAGRPAAATRAGQGRRSCGTGWRPTRQAGPPPFRHYRRLYLTAAKGSRARPCSPRRRRRRCRAPWRSWRGGRASEARQLRRRAAQTVARGTAAVLRLGQAILEAYGRHKQARALLDYDDLVYLRARPAGRAGRGRLGAVQAGRRHRPPAGRRGPGHQPGAVAGDPGAQRGVLRRRGSPRSRPAPYSPSATPSSRSYGFQRARPSDFRRACAITSKSGPRSGARQQTWEDVRPRGLVPLDRRRCSRRSTEPCSPSRPLQAGVLSDERPLMRHDPVRDGEAGLVELWPAGAIRKSADAAGPLGAADGGRVPGAAGGEHALGRADRPASIHGDWT